MNVRFLLAVAIASICMAIPIDIPSLDEISNENVRRVESNDIVS